jgi:hypothetical protein
MTARVNIVSLNEQKWNMLGESEFERLTAPQDVNHFQDDAI